MEQLPTRARLYHLLGEALAEPPAWLTAPGCDWPLFEAALATANDERNNALFAVCQQLAAVQPETPAERQARYDRVVSQLPLYESLARENRLAGPVTLTVKKIYRAAGLRTVGAELPDHAAVELAFLAYLLEAESAGPGDPAQWQEARRLFVQNHVAQWLPTLGKSLIHSGDPVYGPVGGLLVSVLAGERRSLPKPATVDSRQIPAIPDESTCHLCGFCVQVCPSRALTITETDSVTQLSLDVTACVSCNRCTRICPAGAIQLRTEFARSKQVSLRRSPRMQCPACGAPTVSQAEYEAVTRRVGELDWLGYCLSCRSQVALG